MFLSHIKSCILTWSELLPSLQKHWELQLFTISICNANSKKAEFPSVGFDNKQPSKSHTSHPSEPALPGYSSKRVETQTNFSCILSKLYPFPIHFVHNLQNKVGFVIAKPRIVLVQHWMKGMGWYRRKMRGEQEKINFYNWTLTIFVF